jgi:bifunctional non-homologous end joining protein LigD
MDELTAEIDGRVLTLSNLDKPLFPDGFTKGEVIDYYVRVAPLLLPHLRDRVVTRIRFPDGVSGPSFFEKNLSPGLPSWVPRQVVVSPDSTVTYVLVDDAATLAVLANLAALELHTPQWTIPDRSDAIDLGAMPPPSDRLIVDLDPGPGTTTSEHARAALLVANRLAADGLVGVPRTSGSKGLQVQAAIAPTDGSAVTAYVKGIGTELVRQHPDLFVVNVTPSQRVGKVFIDYNQNLTGRNTVSLYSLRGREEPTACTPLTWDEVGAAVEGAPLRFVAGQVLERIGRLGDLADVLLDPVRPNIPQVTD